MINLNHDLKEFIFQNKIDKLVYNRTDPNFLKNRLVSLKELKANWIPARTRQWKEGIVLNATVFSQRPFNVGSVIVNNNPTRKDTYIFSCLYHIDNSAPLSIIPHKYRKFLWVKDTRYVLDLDPNAVKFLRVVDVCMPQTTITNSSFSEIEDEYKLVRDNISSIKFNFPDFLTAFNQTHLLTAEYIDVGGTGKLFVDNTWKIGWSLYKVSV